MIVKYFSMFAGIGGFELAIQRARPEWRCVGYSEINKYAIQTYERHFPTHKNYGDATKIDPYALPNFDLLCGGFPCQAFSITGQRFGFKDTRGTLFFDIARIVKIKRPQYLLLENVKGLLNHAGGRTFSTILATLDEVGYDAEWQVLNSKYFGVPQNRERVFIIGHLRGKRSRQVFPLRQGSKVFDKPNNFQSKIASTLTCSHANYGCGMNLIELTQNQSIYVNRIRKLTPVECERLQDFPDGWTDGVSDNQRYTQCGNAVTVKVVEHIVRELAEVMEEWHLKLK